jgi:hypothetical protein
MTYEYLVLYDGHNKNIECDVHQKILNAYGEKGWELVNVVFPVPTDRADQSFVYFFVKRTV